MCEARVPYVLPSNRRSLGPEDGGELSAWIGEKGAEGRQDERKTVADWHRSQPAANMRGSQEVNSGATRTTLLVTISNSSSSWSSLRHVQLHSRGVGCQQV